VRVAPGVSSNAPDRTHFRVTNRPQAALLRQVFARMEGAPLGSRRGGRGQKRLAVATLLMRR
jgi:hypothetical protein